MKFCKGKTLIRLQKDIFFIVIITFVYIFVPNQSFYPY